MADADQVFDSTHLTFPDVRFPYGEERFITVGYLARRMVLLAWTPRGAARRIISMRKANDREQRKFGPKLG
ncbi:BrnT family toxin [Rhodomicrobium udaipurense]|nr:BrnT family toxin [Rhodomicrobium udaipurense]